MWYNMMKKEQKDVLGLCEAIDAVSSSHNYDILQVLNNILEKSS